MKRQVPVPATVHAGASFAPVRAVSRALDILAETNRLGVASVAELHRRTGYPKPTIVRMLETLIADGYVCRDARMNGYLVTAKSEVLSSGFHGAPLVVQAAQAWAVDLTRRVKWPTAVCTLQGDAVVVRYSTIPDSPISPFHSTLGLRLSLGARALGRAYLAFCPDEERAILANVMRESADPENHFADTAALDALVAETRARGWAERDRDAEPQSSGTVALPIMLGDRVLATFGITYFRRAVPAAERDALVAALRRAVDGVEKQAAILSADP